MGCRSNNKKGEIKKKKNGRKPFLSWNRGKRQKQKTNASSIFKSVHVQKSLNGKEGSFQTKVYSQVLIHTNTELIN